MSIPSLTTERLLLRPHIPSDLAEFVAIFQQPEFYRFLGGKALPEPEVWTKMLRHMGLWPILGYGFWAVEERSTGHFIGAVGFADWQRAIAPSLKGQPEAGWVLAPHIHGRGYGHEAMRAALAWADAHLPQARTVCLIDPGNQPSLQLAAKCGYRIFSEANYHDEPVLLLERWGVAATPV